MLAAGASMARPAVPLDLGDPGLSPALLRTRLSAALLTNGTVDSLKSQLRAKVLSELRAGSGGGRQAATPRRRAGRQPPHHGLPPELGVPVHGLGVCARERRAGGVAWHALRGRISARDAAAA